MKGLCILAAILGFTSFSYALTPDVFLGMAPAVSSNICSATSDEKTAYRSHVDDLVVKLDAEIKLRKKEAKSQAKENKEKEREKMKTYAKGRSVSKADRDEMKNMSKEERHEYLQAKLAEMKAKAQDNAKKGKDNEEQPDPAAVQNMIKGQKEQMELSKKMGTKKEKFRKQLADLSNEAEANYEKEIRPLESKLDKLFDEIGGAKPGYRQAAEKLKSAESRYCRDYSGKHKAILAEYLSFVKTSLNDFNRIEQIKAEAVSTTTGINRPAGESVESIEAIRDYVALLRDVFKYSVRSKIPGGQ